METFDSESALGQAIGYLVVGHGTRSPAGQSQLRRIFSQMTQLAGADGLKGRPAELAFLELAEPNIMTAVERLFQAGVQQLVVVPVLLFSAGHAQHDIPNVVEAAAERFGINLLRNCSSLCLDPTILALSAERFQQALLKHGGLGIEPAIEGVALALIGRGSRSDDATTAMLQFAELRTRATPVRWSSVGFIHAQRPTVNEVLDALAATGLPWLVVQPHLLFEGDLIEELRREVEYRQSLSASQKWIITETLGSTSLDQRLAAALSRLALQSTAPENDDGESCARCQSPSHWCRVARTSAL